jgi:hypothetical protein
MNTASAESGLANTGRLGRVDSCLTLNFHADHLPETTESCRFRTQTSPCPY